MTRLKNWLPAIAMMVIIFTASSIPSNEMPHFGTFDFSVKKLGHSIGYGLLAISYLRGLTFSNRKGREVRQGKPRDSFAAFVFRYPMFLAWLMAVFFAVTDEFHQSFTPGRNPSVWDILIYDNLGTIIGLFVFNRFNKSKQKDDASAPPSTCS